MEIFGPQNKNVEQLLLEVDEAAESKMQAEDKLRTICRKLEPEFEDEDFRIQFTLKNKEYIKKNL